MDQSSEERDAPAERKAPREGGSRTLLWVGLGVCLLLLLAAAGGMAVLYYSWQKFQQEYGKEAPPEPVYRGGAELSAPEDPWANPPVPHQGILVVLPFQGEDGAIYSTATNLQSAVISPWLLASPPGIGVVKQGVVNDTLNSMNHPAWEWDANSVEDAIDFWGGTHVVSGTLTETDGEFSAKVFLSTPDGIHETVLAGKRGEGILLARDVSRFVVAKSGFEISDRDRTVLESAAWSDSFTALEDDRYAALNSSGNDQAWTPVIRESGDHPGVRHWRALAFRDWAENSQLVLLDPGPLPEDAPAWDRGIRSMALLAGDHYRAARHEIEILLANNPSSISYANHLLFDLLPKEEDPRRRVEIAEKWYARAPHTPWVDALMAECYNKAAWEFRGTGWANSVSAKEWQFFELYNEKSSEMLEDVIDRAGPIPWVGNTLAGIYGAGSGEADMMAVHRRVTAKYPHQTSTYYSVLNYIRPRWGGSHEEAYEIVEEALAGSDNWEMGKLAHSYHWREARLEFKGIEDQRQMLREYCDKYPRHEEQLRRSIERLRTSDDARAAAHAAGCAFAIGDHDLAREIVMANPDVLDVARGNCPEDWERETIFQMQLILFGEVPWKDYREFQERLMREDFYWGGQGKQYRVVNAHHCYRDALMGFALVMTGDGEEGIAMLDSADHHHKWMKILPDCGRLIAETDVEAASARLRGYHDESPEDPDYQAMMALVLWREGKREEALEMIQRAGDNPADPEIEDIFDDIRDLIEGGVNEAEAPAVSDEDTSDP